ncbi:hypothetical protein ACH5AL_15215 [Actinacidiphila glaucinigra]|uniref:hypothetical protein n=1 Tax=Actinacidiphila glaucinigra TaxID=235986 RepID=UPI0037B6734E
MIRSNGQVLAEVEVAARATQDGCIIMSSKTGRPRAQLGGVEMHASRAVWVVANGDPGEAHVLHTCHRGDEGCVNIRHLYLGDHGQNMRDMVEAGRSGRGEKNGQAVLTADQVQEIRRLIRRGVPGKSIAAQYGVSKGTVSAIKVGKVWGWLPPDA